MLLLGLAACLSCLFWLLVIVIGGLGGGFGGGGPTLGSSWCFGADDPTQGPVPAYSSSTPGVCLSLYALTASRVVSSVRS
uniref:Putative secreted protein n=1 Tax=Anopheles darlingi TaxID=43151 RepID=A0A2M4DFA5_ANODA